MHWYTSTIFLLLTHLYTIAALRIATSLQWIEHTPQPYAIKNFYHGTSTATLTSGGVANLASDSTFDLAANAETQGLKQYASHRNIRLIYIISEVAYRLVADKRKGITTLSSLRGKKIGTVPSTSASVFIHTLLSTAGLTDSDYTLSSSGKICMKQPCASDTLPAQLAARAIDAVGIWEPIVELSARALGSSNTVIFQNASIYREVYALYSTTSALGNASKRKDIVEFVRALEKTRLVFQNATGAVYDYVSAQVGVDVDVLKSVWGDHKWSGGWEEGELVEFLVKEDAYLAGKDGRGVIPRKELEGFLDGSVLEEVRRGL